jgi:predicted CoA-substrate-specific enzyme activase
MIVLGIDSGSLTTEAVLLDNGQIRAFVILVTGASNRKAAQKARLEVISRADYETRDVQRVVATGYGRDAVEFADSKVTEITCHALGAHYLFPDVRTVIDIGGQDSKVMRVDESGRVLNFAMNDKCAAGTGRFLEVMAHALEVKLDEMGRVSLKSSADVSVSSTCTVFAESEVVGLVAQGYETPDILRAIHRAIASRAAALAGRVGATAPVVMTGGVAKNIGVVKELGEKLNLKIIVPEEPQIVGALGAAIIAERQ